MPIYRVFADGITQDTAIERAPFVGIGPFEVVEARSPEEAVRKAAGVAKDNEPAIHTAVD